MRNCIQLLREAMISNNSLVCCGLDPDVSKVPHEYDADENAVLQFLQAVVNLTAPHVCAFKIQKAFFDIFPVGHEMLRQLIVFIHEMYPALPVLLDCKIGDIGNTMEAYLQNIFEELRADGVVVNPYMGNDVMVPFASIPDKAAVVLVKTSNAGGAVVQDVLLQNGIPFWRYMLELIVDQWNDAGNMIPVLASTATDDMSDIRRIIPDTMPVLFAGYGAQGGRLNQLSPLLNSNGTGVFVNSSRGLLYPYSREDEDWRAAVTNAVKTMKMVINNRRM